MRSGEEIVIRKRRMNEKVKEAQVRDAHIKQEGKIAVDKRRNAKTSDLKPGDQVLLQKHIRKNKLDIKFEHTPYTIMARKGNALQIKNKENEKIGPSI